MIGAIILRETGPTPRLAKRAHNQIIKDTLAETAANHHRFMPKHFTVAGGREYGYKPRKGEGLTGRDFWRSYTGRKKKQKGHTRPLTWSGASETLARIRDVRAVAKRATLIQHARGLNRRNPKSDIDMREEIRTVSESEARVAVQFAGRTLRGKYANIRATQVTKLT